MVLGIEFTALDMIFGILVGLIFGCCIMIRKKETTAEGIIDELSKKRKNKK